MFAVSSVDVFLGVEFDGQATLLEITGGGGFTTNVNTAIHWDGSEWSADDSTTPPQPFAIGPTVSSPAEDFYAKVYVALKPKVLIYDVAGPAFTLRGYMQADVKDPPPSWDWKVGFDGAARGTLEPLGLFKISDVSLKLFDFPTTLAKGTFDAPPGAPGGGMPTPIADPCAKENLGTGYNCGNAANSGDPKTLYYCSASKLESSVICESGCFSSPRGIPDRCATCSDPGVVCDGPVNAPVADPCAKGNLGTGYNCGTPSNGGDSNTLYDCVSSRLQSQQPCPSGCQVEPVGTPDRCISAQPAPTPAVDPCAKANLGTGYDCGTSSNGGDPNTLYDCLNSHLQSQQACSNGCQVQPVGTADRCISTAPPTSVDPCAKANLGTGYNCGTPSNGGDPDTLYYCVSSRLSSSRTCVLGCSIEPAGTPDRCAACPRNQSCPN